MDIYAYAESIDYAADYMDMHTGYIYGIVEYHKNNLPQIPIYDNGRLIGFAVKNNKGMEE